MLVIAFTNLVAPKRAVVLKKESPLWEVIHLPELNSDTFYTSETLKHKRESALRVQFASVPNCLSHEH